MTKTEIIPTSHEKNILRSFVLLCLGSLFFVACQQNEELSEITQELPNDLTLQEAKAWFEQNQLAPSNARVAGEPEIFSKVFWNYSFNYKISKEASNFVVIPYPLLTENQVIF